MIVRSMKTALITGVTGQDGSYLSEFLLEKGADFDIKNANGKKPSELAYDSGYYDVSDILLSKISIIKFYVEGKVRIYEINKYWFWKYCFSW